MTFDAKSKLYKIWEFKGYSGLAWSVIEFVRSVSEQWELFNNTNITLWTNFEPKPNFRSLYKLRHSISAKYLNQILPDFVGFADVKISSSTTLVLLLYTEGNRKIYFPSVTIQMISPRVPPLSTQLFCQWGTLHHAVVVGDWWDTRTGVPRAKIWALHSLFRNKLYVPRFRKLVDFSEYFDNRVVTLASLFGWLNSQVWSMPGHGCEAIAA